MYPITVLTNTTAECLIAALRLRVPQLFQRFRSVKTVLVLNTDSASSNKRVGGHFKALSEGHNDLLCLQSLCMMHMVCASVVTVHSFFDLVSPAFCATLQMHHGPRVADMKALMHAHVERHLRIAFEWDESWSAARPRNEALLDLMFSKHSNPDQEHDDRMTARERSARLLLDLVHDDWCASGPSDIVHFCRWGCCRSRADAVAKICLSLDALLFDKRPKIPALNRWTRLYQPLAWWTVACNMCRIVPTCWVKLKAPPAVEDLITVGIAAGPTTDELFRAKQHARWKKSVRWLTDPTTVPRLSLAVPLMLPALDVMGCLFEGSTAGSDACVIQFAHWQTSPAAVAIRRYAELYADQTSSFWLVYAGSRWTPSTMMLASKVLLMLVGHIFLRCVRPFLGWPWRLAKLANGATSQDEKRSIVAAFLVSDKCCLDSGLSQKIRRMMSRESDLLEGQLPVFLADVFARCPMNNVHIENKFGRQRNFNSGTHGRCPDAGTISSKHVLAEMKALHFQAAKRQRP